MGNPLTGRTGKDRSADAGAWIARIIEGFVANSRENVLAMPSQEMAFDSPRVGFSNGSDPLYAEYVAHIGDFYLTPMAVFRKTFPQELAFGPQDLTVISWVLPSTRRTRQEQAERVQQPSERWVRTRYYGESFNDALRRHLVAQLSDAGIQAVAPVLAPCWSRCDSGPYAPCSNWSERHAAYTAGLGTFGLCDGLITPLGKAMRTGSVIARLSVAPTRRPYTDRHEYCLFYSHGTCGKCIARCPVNAISASGHDKRRCQHYTHTKMKAYALRTFGISTHACGLCQAGVPCADHIPAPDEG